MLKVLAWITILNPAGVHICISIKVNSKLSSLVLTNKLIIVVWSTTKVKKSLFVKKCDKRFMTGPILEKNHMLAIMVRKFKERKFQERNPLKGKALDFENLISKVYKCVYCPKGFWNDIARENSDRSQWSKWSFRNKILIFALMRNSYYSVTFHHHGTLNTLY